MVHRQIRYAIALVLVLTSGLSAHADSYLLSTGAPLNHPWGFGARLWADLVAARTDGRIVFDVVPHAVAAGENGELEFSSLGRGVIDLAVGSSLIWSQEVPSLGVFALPCLVPGEKALETVVTSTVGGRLFRDIERHNVVPLAWGDAGAYGIVSRSGALQHSADFAGRSLRVPPFLAVRESFMVLGVDAITANPRLARLQMELGMIDGSVDRLTELNAAPALPGDYNTWTLWPCIAEPLIFAVNRDVWTDWNVEDRVIVEQAAIEAAIAQAEAARVLARDQGAVLEHDEITFVDVPGDHVSRFTAELKHVRDAWAERVGTELVGEIESVLGTGSP